MSLLSFNRRIGRFAYFFLLTSLIVLMAGQPVHAARSSHFCHEESLLGDMKAFFVPPRGFIRRTSQGMCVAGRYVVYTRYSSDSESTSYVLVDKEKGRVTGHYEFNTRHSNSLTYNSGNGQVVSVSNRHAYVFSLKGGRMRLVRDQIMPRNFCKVAYVAKKGGYYLGTSTGIYFSRDLEKFSKVFDVPKVAVNQGMACDGDYIYINWYRYRNNLIYKYSLNGRYLGRYTLNSSVYCEVEEVDFDNGRMYVNIVNSEANGLYVVKSSHVMQSWHTEKEANCGEEGLMVSTCTRCKREIKKKIPTKGIHVVSGWTVIKAPSCLENGIKARICRKCHKILEKQSVPRTGHSYGHWQVSRKPTTYAEGSMERICEVCHEVETAQIPAKAR